MVTIIHTSNDRSRQSQGFLKIGPPKFLFIRKMIFVITVLFVPIKIHGFITFGKIF